MPEHSAEVKAQLEAQKANCIFCKIISGETPSSKVYEDEGVFAALDIHPAVKGHTLLMPRGHYPIMQYMPPEDFRRLFGILPELLEAQMQALGRTGANVFIANGAAAGQQSPHFLIHLLPREKFDGFNKYMLRGEGTLAKHDAILPLLVQKFPGLMASHFARSPASWHKGSGESPAFLQRIKAEGSPVYEDEKVLCVAPKKPVTPGHLIVYAKEQERDFGKLSKESSIHLFQVASYVSSAVFEAVGAQGTNLILKAGVSDDNLHQPIAVHVLPRMADDDLDLMWEPGEAENLEVVAKQISDRILPADAKEEKKMQTIVLPKIEKIGASRQKDEAHATPQADEILSPKDEIAHALKRLRENR